MQDQIMFVGASHSEKSKNDVIMDTLKTAHYAWVSLTLAVDALWRFVTAYVHKKNKH